MPQIFVHEKTGFIRNSNALLVRHILFRVTPKYFAKKLGLNLSEFLMRAKKEKNCPREVKKRFSIRKKIGSDGKVEINELY